MNNLDKKQLRKEIRLRKQQHTPEQLQVSSADICEQLLQHPRIKAAHTIMAYAALPDEVQTRSLLDTLLQAGKEVLLPVVINDTRLEIRRYTGPDTLQCGSMNIPEPTGEAFTRPETIEVVVVPGMAFDKQGNRLGRGKGYYDRFLRSVPQAYTIGICFPFQCLSQIPTEPTDVTLHEVITARESQL